MQGEIASVSEQLSQLSACLIELTTVLHPPPGAELAPQTPSNLSRLALARVRASAAGKRIAPGPHGPVNTMTASMSSEHSALLTTQPRHVHDTRAGGKARDATLATLLAKMSVYECALERAAAMEHQQALSCTEFRSMMVDVVTKFCSCSSAAEKQAADAIQRVVVSLDSLEANPCEATLKQLVRVHCIALPQHSVSRYCFTSVFVLAEMLQVP